MYGLSSFFIGEQRVDAELGPIMRAAPREDMRVFLCTQIADEARHVAFFDRFYSEVGAPRADAPAGALGRDRRAPEPGVRDGSSTKVLDRRVDRLAVVRGRHGDARRGDHDLPHGDRGDAGPHRPALHHRLQRAPGTLPGFVEGFTNVGATSTATWPSARASCATWRVRAPATARRSGARWARCCPPPTASLRPRWVPAGQEDVQFFGASVTETRAFAQQALERRLSRSSGCWPRPDAPRLARVLASGAARVRPDAARARGAALGAAGRAGPAAEVALAAVLAVAALVAGLAARARLGRALARRRARADRLQPPQPASLVRRRRATARSCGCSRRRGIADAPALHRAAAAAGAVPRRRTAALLVLGVAAVRRDAATYRLVWRGDGRLSVKSQRPATRSSTRRGSAGARPTGAASWSSRPEDGPPPRDGVDLDLRAALGRRAERRGRPAATGR